MPEKSIWVLLYVHHDVLDINNVHIKIIVICMQTFAKGAKV
jgi:hypothetical protein